MAKPLPPKQGLTPSSASLKSALDHAKNRLAQPASKPARPKSDDGLSLEKFAKAWMMAKNLPRPH